MSTTTERARPFGQREGMLIPNDGAGRPAYKWSPGVGNSRAYMGSVLGVPVGGCSTGGRLAVIEVRSRPGTEPPPHVHEWEDEAIRVVEGAAEFYCRGERFAAAAGDSVFMPSGMPHTFRILTPSARMVVTVSSVDGRPVALDRYFLAMSEPAKAMDLPAGATTYATDDDPAHAVRLGAEHGCRFLTPEEVRGLLPGYPGLGAVRR